MLILKKNIYKFNLIGYISIFVTTLLVVFSNINLHYLSTYSPDFQFYKDYLSYFYGEFQYSNREQGLLYFSLVSLFIKLGPNSFSLDNTNQLISNSVQLANLSLYLLGLGGMFLLLKYKGFKKQHILLAFSIVNLFPQTINMIMTMKPEILAFAILPWTIFLIMLFFDTNKYKFLYFSLIPNILLLTSKGTIIGSVLILYLYMIIRKKFQIFTLKFTIVFLLFIVLLTPILIENFNANGKHVFDHTNERATEFLNVADTSFVYSINFHDLYLDPFRHSHANSLIGMVTLDTFGDYYQWYAYNDQGAFTYIKKNFDSVWYITHWSQFFSVILTLLFYVCIIYFYRKDSKNRLFYLLPFFGLIVLLLQAYGVPQKNFDRETAELFKTHYYSYLLIICLIFIVLNFIKKQIILGYFLLALFTFTTSFLYGVPNSDQEYREYLHSKNLHVDTCLLNSLFIDGFNKADCNDKYIDICNFDRIIYNTQDIFSDKENRVKYSEYLPSQKLINSSGNQIFPKNRFECVQAVEDGYFYDSIYLKKIKVPFFNLSYFILFITSIFYLIKKGILLNSFDNKS